MRFELFIAARYLRARRRQAVVGFVTAISVLGVAAGVAALIIALAITNGMRRDLQERLVGATAHVDLMRAAGDGIRDWRPLMEKLSKAGEVEAVAPGLYGQVLISRGPRSGGALIKGIVPADEVKVGAILQTTRPSSTGSETMSPDELSPMGELTPLENWPCAGLMWSPRLCTLQPDGTILTTASEAIPPIVIGQELAATLGATVGDTILVTSPQGDLTPLGLVPRYQRFRVTGIFASGFYQYDASYAFLRLADAQRLFSEPDLVSVLSFRIRDLYKAAEVGKALEQAAGPGFQATNWMQQNRELFRALKLEQVVTFIVLALIVVVAALNILIALSMAVMEKTRDIAVMMSYGVAAGQIRRIFMLQGLLISTTGTLLGLALGYAVALAGSHYRFIHLDASVYSIDYLPFAPRYTDALLVAAVSVCISLLATLYPSSAAARTQPAEALRYE